MAVRILPFPHLNRGKKGNIVQGDTVKIERKRIFFVHDEELQFSSRNVLICNKY